VFLLWLNAICPAQLVCLISLLVIKFSLYVCSVVRIFPGFPVTFWFLADVFVRQTI